MSSGTDEAASPERIVSTVQVVPMRGRSGSATSRSWSAITTSPEVSVSLSSDCAIAGVRAEEAEQPVILRVSLVIAAHLRHPAALDDQQALFDAVGATHRVAAGRCRELPIGEAEADARAGHERPIRPVLGDGGRQPLGPVERLRRHCAAGCEREEDQDRPAGHSRARTRSAVIRFRRATPIRASGGGLGTPHSGRGRGPRDLGRWRE